LYSDRRFDTPEMDHVRLARKSLGNNEWPTMVLVWNDKGDYRLDVTMDAIRALADEFFRVAARSPPGILERRCIVYRHAASVPLSHHTGMVP
jgi:hypothetical protein